MTQYDNEFFRGPPEGSPTLATDQRPTGVEVFQTKPEKTTASADVPVTREEASKDPPKKKSKARRITKAIKLLASCMAAVVITEAATNMAATIEPPAPEEVPTGQYYAGQWPGVEPVHNGVYHMDLEADMGNQIQIPMDGKILLLTAGADWRMCWFEGNGYGAYIDLQNQKTGVYLAADISLSPHQTDFEEDSYTTLITPTGQTLYVRAFFLDFGIYGEEYGLDRDQMAASAEIRQKLVDEIFAGITVTHGTENGWQGIQIGDRLYSQQGPEWYGVGGFGDLEIHIPWVHYTADHNLQNMTPYSRVKVNGITWSIYFAENDTYLWAVPNIEPELCLGGLTARFMCADAVRRGEYISDEEWLEMGGFTSVSQRQTAVDILIECLQHHYALRESRYPRDWPWKGPTDDHAVYWIWAESLRGTWIQFSFGDEAYRINSTDPKLRFHWDRTVGTGDDAWVELEISNMVGQQEQSAVIVTVRRAEFMHKDPERVYVTTQDTDGKTLYLCFNAHYTGDGPLLSVEELQNIADDTLSVIEFQTNPDDSGWSTMLLCDRMHSPQSMEWSGSGIVGSRNEIRYIHEIQAEGLENETPCATRSHNGITWSFYYDVEEEILWAVPDLEPDVCIGNDVNALQDYYRQRYPGMVTDGWNSQYDVPADDVNHAVEAFSEALAHIYPLGVEPEDDEAWYIPDWPMIGQTSMTHSYNLMDYSRYGTFAQFSLGNRSYRLDSGNPNLCFFWNGTGEVDGVMQAALYINHMTNDRRDWRVDLLVQNEPFAKPRDEARELDAMLPVGDGSYLYLRFCRIWDDGNENAFAEWATTVIDAITASPADPNGWGQVWICDLMITPLGPDWDGNAKVNEPYVIPYFNRVAELGLEDLEICATKEFNGISWNFVYEEANDIIWAIPDIENRWCIGAPATSMAVWHSGEAVEGSYVEDAIEGLAEGLSKYYIRQGFVMEPVEEVLWPTIRPSDDGANYTTSLDSNQNTYGLFSLGGNVYRIDSYREDLHFWWSQSNTRSAQIQVYSMGEGGANWIVTMEVQQMEFDVYEGDVSCYRTVVLPGGEMLYLRFESWNFDDTPVENLADMILEQTSFDNSGAEEQWHIAYIGNTLQSRQSYNWTGLRMVYQDYRFRYLHNAESKDVHLQDYKGQRTINGILWTFRFHKDDDVFYAYPDTEPDLCIGAETEVLYRWYEAQYGTPQDYFEALVESMCEGLSYITLRDSQ